MLAETVPDVHYGHGAPEDCLPAGIERRGAARFQTRTVGQIFPVNGFAPMPCMITDISATGARLMLLPGWLNPYQDPHGIGQQFRLLMRIDRVQVPCSIVRIEANSMGVRFAKALEHLPRSVVRQR